MRSPERIRADFQLLSERHGAPRFFFADDALPPAVVQSLAREGLGTKEPLHWQAELRWDALCEEQVQGLAHGGARNLVFGLESGSQRVLRRMRKGSPLSHARKLILRCTREGIGVNLQCFLGFPGETLADAAATLRFLDEVRGPTTTVSCGLFELQKGSLVWRDPASFGKRIKRVDPAEDLTTRFEYEPQRGRAARLRLIDRIHRRFEPKAPQLRCGIHAHALLHLSAGVSAAPPATPVPAPLTQPLSTGPGDPLSLTGKPRREPTVIAFSLEHPTCVSIGPVAAAILRACDGHTRASDLLAALPRPARPRVRRVLRQLARLGLISVGGG